MRDIIKPMRCYYMQVLPKNVPYTFQKVDNIDNMSLQSLTKLKIKECRLNCKQEFLIEKPIMMNF